MHAGTVQDEGSEFLEYIHYQDNLTAYNSWLPKRFQGQMIDAVNKTYPVKNVACQQALCLQARQSLCVCRLSLTMLFRSMHTIYEPCVCCALA